MIKILKTCILYIFFLLKLEEWVSEWLLAHLTQRVMWGIAITWHPSSVHPSVNFFIFYSTPLKQLGQMEPNLAESIYIRSSIKFLHFVPFRQQIWPPRAILVSDWLMLKKSSPLKLLGQIEPNLAESIYVRSSIIFFIWFHSANKYGHCY